MRSAYLKKVMLSFFALLAIALLSSCEKDEDLATRELLIYVAACPTSQSQCQGNCSDVADTDNNGVIEGVETQYYSVCVSDCSYACSQAFWYYLLNDE